MPTELRAHVELGDCTLAEFAQHLFSTGHSVVGEASAHAAANAAAHTASSSSSSETCDEGWWILDEFAVSGFVDDADEPVSTAVAIVPGSGHPHSYHPHAGAPRWRHRELAFDVSPVPSTIRSYLGLEEDVHVIERCRVTRDRGEDGEMLVVDIVLEVQGALATTLGVTGRMSVEEIGQNRLAVGIVLTTTINANFFIRGTLETGVSTKGASTLAKWETRSPAEAAELLLRARNAERARLHAAASDALASATAATDALAAVASSMASDTAGAAAGVAGGAAAAYAANTSGEATSFGTMLSTDTGPDLFFDVLDSDPSPERTLLVVMNEYAANVSKALDELDAKLGALMERTAHAQKTGHAPTPPPTPTRRPAVRSAIVIAAPQQQQQQPAGWFGAFTLRRTAIAIGVLGVGVTLVRLVSRKNRFFGMNVQYA